MSPRIRLRRIGAERPRFRKFVLLALLLVTVGCSPLWVLPPREDAERVRIPVGSVTLRGYLFSPKGSVGLAPAVILLSDYGAGLRDVIAGAQKFAEAGFVSLVISMRGGIATGGRNRCALQQPADIVHALEWLSERPEADKNRIALFGVSQGAQVALLAGARSGLARAIVAISPPTDIDLWHRTTGHPGVRSWIASMCEGGKKGARLRSPIEHVDKIKAPVLLIHGKNDTRVPAEQSRVFAAAMHNAGKTAQLKLIDGAAHRLSAEHFRQAWEWCIAFLSRHLREHGLLRQPRELRTRART